MSSVTNAIELLSDSVFGQWQRKRRSNDDLVTSLTLRDGLVKAHRAIHLVDVNHGIGIFRFTLSVSDYSSLIMQCVNTIIGVHVTDKLPAPMNRRVQVGQSTSFVVFYLDPANGRLHDTVLNKFSNAFLQDSLPPIFCRLRQAHLSLKKRSLRGV